MELEKTPENHIQPTFILTGFHIRELYCLLRFICAFEMGHRHSQQRLNKQGYALPSCVSVLTKDGVGGARALGRVENGCQLCEFKGQYITRHPSVMHLISHL